MLGRKISLHTYPAKMENVNIPTIIFVILGALVLIFFLAKKNQKDKKDLNPDAQDAVEKEKTEQENERERL